MVVRAAPKKWTFIFDLRFTIYAQAADEKANLLAGIRLVGLFMATAELQTCNNKMTRKSYIVNRKSGVAIRDARLVQVVLRHLDVDLVTDGDPDEILPHLPGNMRQHLVTVGQFDTEHRSREHLGDRSRKFDVLFAWHGEN